LVLLGGLSAGALSGCGPSVPRVTTDDVFTNNHYIPGVGYYHAPFRGWYSHPYNYYDGKMSAFYQGGMWLPTPHQSVVNISSPTPEAAHRVAQQQHAVRRGGFGSTSRSSWISS
jgi:hypothetical protein